MLLFRLLKANRFEAYVFLKNFKNVKTTEIVVNKILVINEQRLGLKYEHETLIGML